MVTDALRRLGNGTYGHCDARAGPIAVIRLEAVPATTRGLACATRTADNG